MILCVNDIYVCAEEGASLSEEKERGSSLAYGIFWVTRQVWILRFFLHFQLKGEAGRGAGSEKDFEALSMHSFLFSCFAFVFTII